MVGSTDKSPVVPVGLFLANYKDFLPLDLRLPVVPVVAPVVPAVVQELYINSSSLISNHWLFHSFESTSKKTVSKL